MIAMFAASIGKAAACTLRTFSSESMTIPAKAARPNVTEERQCFPRRNVFYSFSLHIAPSQMKLVLFP